MDTARDCREASAFEILSACTRHSREALKVYLHRQRGRNVLRIVVGYTGK